MTRRASARRRYNAVRREHAEERRAQVVLLLNEYGMGRGVQARIAYELGVSAATISRDVRAALRPSERCYCPTCGTSLPRATYELLVG
jgi:hypothetical protein